MPRRLLGRLGPGIISGASDDDPTTVATLAVVGATTVYESWLVLRWFVLPFAVAGLTFWFIVVATGATLGRRSRRGRVPRPGRDREDLEGARMAEVVCAFGVPHTPAFPALAEREGPDGPVARLYGAVRAALEAVRPDVLLVYDSDHVNTFFFNNWPTFAIGVRPAIAGPNDDNSGLPKTLVPSHEELAHHLYAGGVTSGFDFALTQKFEVDHSIMVPLHFVTPQLDVPIVPLFINGVAPPLPAAKRCFALGAAIRDAVERWPAKLRVGVLASGSFSLDVAGPMMEPGGNSGVPARDWSDRVVQLLGTAKIEDLLEEATADRIAGAGNVAGEILNWIAMLGMLGKRKPAFVEKHDGHGHAFAAWRWD